MAWVSMKLNRPLRRVGLFLDIFLRLARTAKATCAAVGGEVFFAGESVPVVAEFSLAFAADNGVDVIGSGR